MVKVKCPECEGDIEVEWQGIHAMPLSKEESQRIIDNIQDHGNFSILTPVGIYCIVLDNSVVVPLRRAVFKIKE